MFARGVTILNSRSVSSIEKGVRKQNKKDGNHTHFHQLNGRKRLVVFNSAVSVGLHHYGQI
jgi:hypothetical protein